MEIKKKLGLSTIATQLNIRLPIKMEFPLVRIALVTDRNASSDIIAKLHQT